MNPERMVIQEARRAHSHLQLYGYGVDAAIVNRVAPADEGGVMERYVASQTGYLAEIEDTFAPIPIPILRVPHAGQEVFGLGLLRGIGDGVYGAPGDADARDPAAVMHAEATTRVEPDGTAYVVAIKVPYAEADEVEAEPFGDALVVQVRDQRRNVMLPAFLASYRLAGAAVEDGWLRARFEPEA